MLVPRVTLVLSCLALGACTSLPDTQTAQPSVWAVPTDAVPPNPLAAGWEHLSLPGKQPAQFKRVRLDEREAVAVTAKSAASMLRRKIRVEPQQLGRLRFSWKVPQLIAQGDLGVREKADSAVRIILAFDGDRSRMSARDHMLSELAHGLTGEPMPYATLMYVWCNQREPGSVIRNPRTDRIRKLVLESGPGKLNQWLEYERDVRADFRRVFGEEPGALVGVAIMTDSDNTRSSAQAWYGPLELLPPLLP
jgi:hypothetical protein